MSAFLSTVRRLTYLLGCLVVALAFAALPTQAESTASDTQTVVLSASQDATIDSLNPLMNLGNKPDLGVVFGIDRTSGRFEQDALLQFDLASIPPGSTITSAKLGLNLTTATGSTSIAGYSVTSAWNESSVTYKDRPTTGSSPVFVQDVPADPRPRQVTFDVTVLADNWVDQPTSNFGLFLRPTATSPVQRIFDSGEGASAPALTVEFTLPPIRVCRDAADPCTPLDGAAVFDLTLGQAEFTTASGGLVQDKGAIQLDDQLWVKHMVESLRKDLGQYCTTAQPVPVTAANFHDYPNAGSELRLVVDCRQPVLLQDLVISTWYMEDDPARKQWLAANVIQASDYLFDFSEGRVALGKVLVRQNYVGWAAANIKLHTSNTLHPNANIGGIVPGETPDISPTVAISYTPGSIFMGSYWNRFGTPPDQVNIYKGAVVPPATLASDWAIALAHELSHYLFFLFDTYTDKEGHSNEAIAAQCTGSAMGNAYESANHAFVLNQGHWDTACNATEAHARLLGRTEWATITGWYPWLTAPTTIVVGERPSGPLTQVIFEPVAPNSAPAPLAASQIFSLTYQAGEQSSGEARAFLLRADSRIFDQGKPAKNATTVQLPTHAWAIACAYSTSTTTPKAARRHAISLAAK